MQKLRTAIKLSQSYLLSLSYFLSWQNTIYHPVRNNPSVAGGVVFEQRFKLGFNFRSRTEALLVRHQETKKFFIIDVEKLEKK